jgi:hypothetical protein
MRIEIIACYIARISLTAHFLVTEKLHEHKAADQRA